MHQHDLNSSALSVSVPRGLTRLGLSAKLLLLTVLFVMLAEVLIYLPSVANFRMNWLNDRLAAAQIAVLVLEGGPQERLPEGSETRLLMGVGARAIAARVGGARRLLSLDSMPVAVSRTVDLRHASWFGAIGEALQVLLNPPSEMPIRVVGQAMGSADFVEMVLDEAPLRRAMVTFSINILLLSLVISGLTAGLVYLALNWMIVGPIRQLAANVMEFEVEPENPRRIIEPSQRADEIGEAERALARMQMTLADELRDQEASGGTRAGRQQDQPRPAQHAGRGAADVGPAGRDARRQDPPLRAPAHRNARPRHRVLPGDAGLWPRCGGDAGAARCRHAPARRRTGGDARPARKQAGAASSTTFRPS